MWKTIESKLIDDWKKVLRKSWSVRFALLAGVISSGDVVIGLIANANPSPRWIALAGLSSFVSMFARVVEQPKMKTED